MLTPGTHVLSVVFTPTDTANYSAETVSVPLTIGAGRPTIVWPAPVAITYPSALGVGQLNATANVAAAPISSAPSVFISACEKTRIPSRSTSPSCSSRSLATNAL